MSGHTPGPWEVREAGGNPYSVNAPSRAVINWGGFSKPIQPESHANARLIAAAPDLLAASVKLLDALYGPLECTHDNKGDEDICDGCAYQREKAAGHAASKVRAAIAKAEGR